MDWIKQISCNDDVIKNILYYGDSVVLAVTHWDGSEKKIKFNNYYAVKEKSSIGVGIGEVFVKKESLLLNEIRTDVINGGGDGSELINQKSFQFMDEWDSYLVLEIIAEEAILIE